MFKLCLLNIILFSSLVHAEELSNPYVVKDACPFEGCSFGVWAVNKQTDVYEAPNKNSKVVFTLSAGTNANIETGVLYVVPGKARVTGKPYKSASTVNKDKDILILDYIGEGYSRIYQDGEFYETKIARTKDQCSKNSNWRYCWVKIIEEPIVEWWVKANLVKGNISGWVLMKDKTLSPIDVLSEYMPYNMSFKYAHCVRRTCEKGSRAA